MSYRSVNLVVFAGIAALCLAIINAMQSMRAPMEGDIGAWFLPSAVAWLILGLCVIGVIRTFAVGRTEAFVIPALGRILISILIIALFMLSWIYLGAFYLQMFVFLMVLSLVYRKPVGLDARQVIITTAVSAAITLFSYIVFAHLIYVDL